MPFAAALSTATAIERALDEVCSRVSDQMPASPELATVFFTPQHADQAGLIARTIQNRLQSRCLIGCMGEAVVGTGQEIEHLPGLSLWAGHWTGKVQLDPCHLVPRQTPDGLSLLGWPDALVESNPAAATLLLIGDPFTFPAMEIFLPQVNADYRGLRVYGGMSSGMVGPGNTPLLLGPDVHSGGAVGVLLSGPVPLRGVVSQGCRPVGRPLVITKGRDNIILELGGKPPLEQLRAIYQELPAHDQELFQKGPHVGLVINEYQDSFGRGDFFVRNLHAVDRDSGAMAITDHVRIGQTVRFHVRDAETADEDLRLLLRQDVSRHSARLGGALLFTCNGRGTRLFGKPHHDAGVIQAELGPLPLAGLFAAGELGPVGGQSFIHGFTASVVLFEEL